MAELTIIFDNWSHHELKEYLASLNGVLEVIIKNDEFLEIYIKYDPILIDAKILKMEIVFFLNIIVPSLISFDKHLKENTTDYKIIREDICCEWCFMGAIEDLFEIDGISSAYSNFNPDEYTIEEPIVINVKYNPQIISAAEMKIIESKLNI